MLGCGEDFDVVEAAVGAAEEGALAVAVFFFAGFGAVLVDGVDPAAGDAGEEVLVVVDGGAVEAVLHPGQGVRVGNMPDAFQCGGDDGSGVGRDGSGGQGGGGFFVFGGHGVAGQAGAGEHGCGQGEPAAGFADADPQPGPEVLGGVPASVIGRGAGARGRRGREGTRRSRGLGIRRRSCRRGACRGCAGVGSPAGGPARRSAGGSRGDDCLAPGFVHCCSGEQLEVFDLAGEILHDPGEIGCFGEGRGGEVVRGGGHGRVQQAQAPPHVRGSTAVGRGPWRPEAGAGGSKGARGGNTAKPAALKEGGSTEAGRARSGRGVRCTFLEGFHEINPVTGV